MKKYLNFLKKIRWGKGENQTCSNWFKYLFESEQDLVWWNMWSCKHIQYWKIKIGENWLDLEKKGF